jgi:glycyl-radical enzyme activating protein
LGVTGAIFDVQTFCIHDGPGIRTTVFLKGCPLRCLWCHNPESLSRRRELLFDINRCRSCGACAGVCPSGVHSIVDGKHLIDRERCSACEMCAEACFANALEVVGREATVDEVMAIVLKDVPFYRTSGGGMTVSGGEPLAQPEFTLALLRAAKGDDIHCCVETSGFGDWQSLDSLIPYTDLFLFDIKETDPDMHSQFTGVSLEPILENLRKLYTSGADMRLRLPLVSGYNARPGHFECIGRLVEEMPGLQGVEIMPYHRLGEGKRERLGRGGLEYNIDVPDDATIASWVAQLNRYGVDVAAR